MGSESDIIHPMNLNELVKKILLAFFEVNVSYFRNLDVYGSVHVRSDDIDVICCVLNEHCYKPEKLTNSADTEPVARRTGTSHQGTIASNNEFMPDWAGRSTGGKRFNSKKTTVSGLVMSKGDPSSEEIDMQAAKRRKTSGPSRKLSKLNKSTSLNVQYPPESVFPEPMPFDGSGDNEKERSEIETCLNVKHDCGTSDHENEKTKILKVEEKRIILDEMSTDENVTRNIGMEDEGKTGVGFNRTIEDEELVNLDSAEDSQDFDQAGKVGPFPFGSQQSFSTSQTSFNDSELFSQSPWLHADANSHGSNQIPCPEPNFDIIKASGNSVTPNKICGYCLKIFHSQPELRQHIQQNHNRGFLPMDDTEERPYRPRYQNTYIYGGSELDADKQMTCSVCNLSFRSLDGLRCHENSKHSRNKLYKCQFCPQSFLTRQAAYTHRMKFHRLMPRKLQSAAGPVAPIM